MRLFRLLFIIISSVMFCLTSPKLYASQPTEEMWEWATNIAASRTEYHRTALSILNNQKVDIEQRVALAKQLTSMPENYSTIASSVELQAKVAQKNHIRLINQKFLDSCIKDLTFAGYYWDFMLRTLSVYQDQNSRGKVMWYLFTEHSVFDTYCLKDVSAHPNHAYSIDEKMFSGAIIDALSDYSQTHGIELPRGLVQSRVDFEAMFDTLLDQAKQTGSIKPDDLDKAI